MDLTDICKVFHLTAAEHTYFPEPYRTFFKIDHSLGHKARLNTHKKTEIVSYILSEHNEMKLHINSKINYRHIQMHEE
jgi:hypothetical protein